MPVELLRREGLQEKVLTLLTDSIITKNIWTCLNFFCLSVRQLSYPATHQKFRKD